MHFILKKTSVNYLLFRNVEFKVRLKRTLCLEKKKKKKKKRKTISPSVPHSKDPGFNPG